MTETILTNARLVLPDEVAKGTLVIRNGRIAEIDTGSSRIGEDLEGDFLIPGIIELHTDHFENHYRPRPGVTWNAIAALQSHDAQVAGAGITTVFDAIRIGSDPEVGDITEDVTLMVEAVATAQAENRLRAEHRIHLRCELPTPDAAQHFEAHSAHPLVGLASLMDHTPGARQYTTLEHYVAYYQKKLRLSDDEMAAYIRDRQADAERWSANSKREILALGRSAGLAFASHDDATTTHVAEAVADGVVLAEFPTTLEAARAAHQAGMAVLMGAPNLVRGKSHNGNVSALDLARAGTLDVLSSDYVPFSLIQAAFLLPELHSATSLPQAIRMVTRRSAEAVGLTDRGALETGLRADLVRAWRPPQGVPVVRSVWREGQRVS